ncbi:hypothetical protein V5799_010566, partial [Amblyomma americanum]
MVLILISEATARSRTTNWSVYRSDSESDGADSDLRSDSKIQDDELRQQDPGRRTGEFFAPTPSQMVLILISEVTARSRTTN